MPANKGPSAELIAISLTCEQMFLSKMKFEFLVEVFNRNFISNLFLHLEHRSSRFLLP